MAYVLLATGALLLLLGMFTDSGGGFFASSVGVMLLFVGALMLISLSIIGGLPWFARLVSRLAEPVWDGEIIHADGNGSKIRYDFDEDGSPWFVATDVCVAIGTRTPAQGVMKWGGVPLLMRGKHACFSGEDIPTYLIPLPIHNHAASSLLVNIRNNVLRKLEKDREDRQRYG
ncbi:MAG: hypothetical protein U1C96_09800 [Gallionella sp.]|nr:hypothetical protein [Gallionella sp.]